MKLHDLVEAKNHMGESEYTTFASWKRAIKAAYPSATFEGDQDIANAKADGKGVGEWDGAVGCVYNKIVNEAVSPVRAAENYINDAFYVYDRKSADSDASIDYTIEEAKARYRIVVTSRGVKVYPDVDSGATPRRANQINREVVKAMSVVNEGSGNAGDRRSGRNKHSTDSWKDDPENRMTGKDKPTVKVGPGEYMDPKTKTIRDRKTDEFIRTYESVTDEEGLRKHLDVLKSDLKALGTTPGNQKEADAIDNLRDEITDIEAKLKDSLTESDDPKRDAWDKWKNDVRAICPDATFGPSARADGPVPTQQQAVWWNSNGNPEIGNWKDGKGEVYPDFEKRVKRVKEDVNLPKFKSSLASLVYKQKIG